MENSWLQFYHIAVTAILSPIQDTRWRRQGIQVDTTCIRATCIRCKRGIISSVHLRLGLPLYQHFPRVVRAKISPWDCMSAICHLVFLQCCKQTCFWLNFMQHWLISEWDALSSLPSINRRRYVVILNPINLFLSSALSVHTSAPYKATDHTKDVNNLIA